MARIYKLLEVAPDPKRPKVTVASIEVTDTDTGKVLFLKEGAHGTGLDLKAVSEAVGLMESGELAKRDNGLEELKALIAAGGIITPIAPKQPTQPEKDHQQFHNRLRKLTTLKAIQPIVDAQLATAMGKLQGQVEAYLIANPDAI